MPILPPSSSLIGTTGNPTLILSELLERTFSPTGPRLKVAAMVKRVYFLAHGGMVQGVGFRYFTRHRAVEHKLTGWVRNTDNNKVEGEAQGEADSVALFLKHLDIGPRHAQVVRLDKEDREVVEGESEFEIRR